MDLEDGYQLFLPRNTTNKHKEFKSSEQNDDDDDDDEDEDAVEYSGTGSILENTAPNLIKVTHR